ncbi:MAG: ribonucleoside-diphosphate reductase subunit alpha [Alphaproteobacteria bacterium]|nr:ribonucleoside-diphosphate reductase subunit alpha [Alphaproteobacteria bacterium]
MDGSGLESSYKGKNQGDMLNMVQVERGKSVEINPERDNLLTAFGKATLEDRYLMPDETPQDLFARVASYFSDDDAHAQRIYDYMSRLWFMPSTPVLSNGGTERGLPISCFLNESDDSLQGIVDLWNENVWLASRGGGIGSYWGNLRSIGEKVGKNGKNGKTSGVIPFIRVMDSLTLAISQGSLRRGSAACYLPVWHPEIEEFIEMRRPTGGDPNRKALNLHHGIVIPDAFMRAVEANEEWALKSPKDGAVQNKVSARDLWIRILTARVETGEPYLLFIDRVNADIPQHQKLAGMRVKMSNLCSEITLPTGIDRLGNDRTAVCCLSSLNLETYDEWKNVPGMIEDIMRFLDNVLQDFIDRAPDSMSKAQYSAMRERSVGLGVMGFQSFLQMRNVPMESVTALSWNKKIFKKIREEADLASKILAKEKGACPDAADFGIEERFSNKLAVAPTASISIICGGASPGIEPSAGNSFVQKTLSGSFNVRNPHLKQLLEEKNKDTDDIWSSITTNKGSVQHLGFLTQHEKDVFKSAFEIDQRWLIDLAAQRTPYICQSQSLNVFIAADVHKKDLHQIHFQAWKKGIKSMYYLRSMSIQRSDVVSNMGQSTNNISDQENSNDYEECLSCQ